MNIYKVANEFTFKKPEALKKYLGKLSKENFRDLVSYLSQIHETFITENMSLSESIELALSPDDVPLFSKIISWIGENEFKNSDFGYIVSQLETFTTDAKDIPIAPVEKKEVDPKIIAQKNLPPAAIVRLDSKIREQYLLSLPHEQHDEPKIKNLIDDINQIELFKFDATISEDIEEFNEQMIDCVLQILELSEEYKDSQVQKEEELNKKIRDDEFLTKNLRQHTTPEEPIAEESDYQEYNQKISLPLLGARKVKTEELPLFAQIGAENYNKFGNFYIDFSEGLPAIRPELEKTVTNALLEIKNMFREYSNKGTYSPKRREKTIITLNTILFAMKEQDMKAYKSLESLIKSASKEYVPKLQSILDEFVQSSFSTRILEKENADYLFRLSMLLSSPKLGYSIVLDKDNKILSNFVKNKSLNIEPLDLKEVMEDRGFYYFMAKAKLFFDFRITSGYRNFLGNTVLNFEIISRVSLNRLIPTGPKYVYSSCPVCWKKIPTLYSKEARERNPGKYEGFHTRPISFFTGGELSKITMDTLKSGKWPALPSKLFKNEREKALMEKYSSVEKTWDEIEALLNSNNPELHEEGVHRRNGALYAAGGVPLTSAEIRIKNMQVECPYDSKSTGSACGASFVPDTKQSTWNGLSEQITELNNNSNNLKKELWKDEGLYARAKKKMSAGYKFSKFGFNCTCRIVDDNTDVDKNNLVAISKSGAPLNNPDFVYPTKPDGSLDKEIPPDTLAFPVCATFTSLSSVDFDKASATSIIKHLYEVQKKSINEYISLCQFLLKYGFDVVDLIELDSELDQFASESKKVTSRLESLEDIMVKVSQMKLTKEEDAYKRKLIGGLTLVCPFGHKFNVEHSLNFGGAYFSSNISFKNLKNKKLIYSEPSIGLGFLKFPIDSSYNIMPYETWKQVPGKKLSHLNENDLKTPTLGYLSEDKKVYYVRKRINKSLENIWNPEESHFSLKKKELYMEVGAEKRQALTMESSVESGDGSYTKNISDEQVYKNWMAEQGSDSITKVSAYSFPGAAELEDDNGNISEAGLSQRVAGLAKAIKSILTVITTYTKGIVNDTLINAAVVKYDPKLEIYAPTIIKAINKFLEIKDENDQIIPFDPNSQIISELTTFLGESLNSKATTLLDFLSENQELLGQEGFEQKAAAKILQGCLSEINSVFDSPNGTVTFINGVDDDKLKKISERVIVMQPELLKSLVAKTDSYADVQKSKVLYNGRLIMISFAKYMANALSNMYKKYCIDPKSELYIGYDIGVDLSSVEKIMGYEKNNTWVDGISKSDVDRIPSSLAEIINLNPDFGNNEPGTLHHGYRIDRFWEELNIYIAKSESYLLSSKGMISAKEYLLSRMGTVKSQDPQLNELKKEISSMFPSRSLLFNGTSSDPETSNMLINKSRLPIISKERNFTDLPGTKMVEEWIISNPSVNGSLVASSKEEAETLLAQVKSKPRPYVNPEAWRITESPYYVNYDINYDGRKNQIGRIRPPVQQDFFWPPPQDGWNMVGVNLPFASSGRDGDLGKSKNVPIDSYRMIISYEGEPLDISFLFRRGRESDQLQIQQIEKFLEERYEEFNNDIIAFKQQNAKKILKDSNILEDYRVAREQEYSKQIEDALDKYNSIQLTVFTASSYVDMYTGQRRPMMHILLENPKRAYDIVMNSESKGINLTEEEKQRYVRFIISAYNLGYAAKLAARFYKDPTITAYDLLAGRPGLDLSKFGYRLKEPEVEIDGQVRPGWLFEPGEYFDIEPGNIDTDSGSYLQYVYSPITKGSQYGKHPDVSALIASSKTFSEKSSTTNVNKTISKNLSKRTREYIMKQISTELSAKRNLKKSSIKKIYEILDNDIEELRTILGVGQEFSDVEIFNY